MKGGPFPRKVGVNVSEFSKHYKDFRKEAQASQQEPFFAQAMMGLSRAENRKIVSAAANKRLEHCRAAIDFTKETLKYGAGNQEDDIRRSRYNSVNRKNVVRTPRYWRISPRAQAIASSNPKALHAAKAMVAQGGNCGEHAYLAYNYLRATAKGETIHLGGHKMDHAYALVGPSPEQFPSAGAETAVADPWPTKPTAVLWEDFFAFEQEPSPKASVSKTMVADGKAPASLIAANISLTDEGKKVLVGKRTAQGTEKFIDEAPSNVVWNQETTTNNEYDYQEEE